MADVDLGSEFARFLGYIRAYFLVAYRILFPRAYLCKVCVYWVIYNEKCPYNMLNLFDLQVSYLPLPVDNAGKPVPVGSGSGRIQMPAMGQPVPDNWVTLTGRFFIVYAINIPLLDPMTLLSPDSRHSAHHFVIKALLLF